MAMDRRQFLRLFSSASLAAIAPLDQLVAFDQRKLSSPAFGFSFAVPTGWYCPTIEEIKHNLSKQTFVAGSQSEDEAQPTPLVSVYRYPEPYVGMNPAVVVYGDRFSDWMLSPLDLANNYVDYFTTIVEDGCVVMRPRPAQFGGIDALECAISYRAVVEEDDFECYVTDFTRVVHHRDKIIFFLYEQSLDGSARADDAFSSIDKSVSFI